MRTEYESGNPFGLQACCIMFDEKPKMVDDPAKLGKKVPSYWDAAKRLLADPTKFLDSLFTYDKDNIKDAIIQRIQPYIDMEEFTPEAVARVRAGSTCLSPDIDDICYTLSQKPPCKTTDEAVCMYSCSPSTMR